MSKNKQKAALDGIGFNLMSDCDAYWGKLIDKDLWRVPDIDTLRGYFESSYEDPDERMAKYERDRKLKPEERKKFREHLIGEALGHDSHPALFAGTLSCGNKSLVVLSDRTGGGWDCEAFFLGVFADRVSALQVLAGNQQQLIDAS
jgi:hypothetical protein